MLLVHFPGHLSFYCLKLSTECPLWSFEESRFFNNVLGVGGIPSLNGWALHPDLILLYSSQVLWMGNSPQKSTLFMVRQFLSFPISLSLAWFLFCFISRDIPYPLHAIGSGKGKWLRKVRCPQQKKMCGPITHSLSIRGMDPPEGLSIVSLNLSQYWPSCSQYWSSSRLPLVFSSRYILPDACH